ncbi:hypothetical protein C0416_00275 [bacterium]|nr:hypothetical protein [bacterium]
MIILKKIQTGIFVTITFLLMFNIVNAQNSTTNRPNLDDLIYTFTTEGNDVTSTDYIASLPSSDPGLVLGQITYYALVVANILAFISFLASGVFMLISQGNDEQLGKAKSILTYTVLAMVICALALALVTGITKLQFFNP